MMKYVAVFIILTSTIFINSGCAKKETTVAREKSVNVAVQAVEKRNIRPFVETVGTLNPYEEVTVSAEVDGILQDVRVDEGTVVSRGTILADIDDTDYALEVRRVKAALMEAESNLVNTRLEYQRKDALYKEGHLSQQDFDALTARLSLSEAHVESSKANLALAEQRLTKTKIYSPISGVVKERKVSPGNFVRNGTPLCTVIQLDPIKLAFAVPAKDAGRLKPGQDVIFKVETFPDREFKGRVSIIYPGLEEKTRTLQVEAHVPNPGGHLKPGLFTKVILYTGEAKGKIVIPVTALLYEGEKVKVFTVDNGMAKEKEVKTGSKYGEFIEIAAGLREGESVVIAGQQNLAEGIKVNVAR